MGKMRPNCALRAQEEAFFPKKNFSSFFMLFFFFFCPFFFFTFFFKLLPFLQLKKAFTTLRTENDQQLELLTAAEALYAPLQIGQRNEVTAAHIAYVFQYIDQKEAENAAAKAKGEG
jgi:hypothetical protein